MAASNGNAPEALRGCSWWGDAVANGASRQEPFVYAFWAASMTLLITLVVRHLFSGGMQSHF